MAGMWTALDPPAGRRPGSSRQHAARPFYEQDENQPLADRLLFNWADTNSSSLRRSTTTVSESSWNAGRTANEPTTV